MPTLRDYKLFKLLAERNKERDIVYAGKLITISNDIGSLLQYIKNVFPDYPDHGIQHSFRIIEHIEVILGERIHQLSSSEIFCFILATLFHDTGMTLVGYAEKESLRSTHPQNASIVIDTYFKDKLQDLKSRERIKSIVKYVCKAHGLDIREMYHDPYFWKVDTIEGDAVRCSLLSVLLRIGDLLDMDEQRISDVAGLLLPELYSDEAKEHNDRHLHILTYLYDPDNLNVEVEAPTLVQYKLWKKWLGYLEEEIRYANSDLRIKEITFPVLKSSIKKDNTDYEIEELRFEIDEKGGIWDILSQSIYTNQFDFVREILQNSIDATLLQKYLNENAILEHCSPRAWGVVTEADSILICYSEKKAKLYVVDEGTGMDASDLRKFLFKVSSTAYKEQPKRSFQFPSIAKYGIGFVSCLINADTITIYTAKNNQTTMHKVVLETDLNEAFLQQVSFDGYEGTTLQLQIKKSFSFSSLYKYLIETIRFPSVGITLIDIDKFEEACIGLSSEKRLKILEKKPYQIVHISKEIDTLRKSKITPFMEDLRSLHEIEDESNALLSWIKNNADLEADGTDAEKYSEFKEKAFSLASKLPHDLKRSYPFAKGKVSQRDLFNSPNEYISNAELFIEKVHISISNVQKEINKYPNFQHAVGSANIALSGIDWKYLVFVLDKDFRITQSILCNDPVNLGNQTGLIIMRQSHVDYDSGIEFEAVNGFLFNNGSICSKLTFVSGFHEVLYEKREESFIVSSIDCHDKLQERLEEEIENSMNSEEDEVFLIRDSSGGYYPGMYFSNTFDTLFINNNKFCFIKNTNELELQNILRSPYSFSTNLATNDLAINRLFYSASRMQEQDIDARDELHMIFETHSAYYQDGIFVPVSIEKLFPVGFFRILCNMTCNARMALNVTRHEPSRISSDISTWFKQTGIKMQEILYRNVVNMLDAVSLSHSFSQLAVNSNHDDIFEDYSIEQFKRVIHSNHKANESAH